MVAWEGDPGEACRQDITANAEQSKFDFHIGNKAKSRHKDGRLGRDKPH